MSASVWQAPLSEFQLAVGAPQPAPAGVAVSCVAAALGLSLLIKVLRIRGKHEDLIEPALALVDELRATADADIAAVNGYVRTRDARGMKAVPGRAAKAVSQGLILCSTVSGSITGLIAADVAAATALLAGAAAAIEACIAANR